MEEEMAQQFAVVGLGRFGTSVALELAELGTEVLAIDRDLQLVEEIADHVTQAVSLDAVVRGNLEAHDVPSMDGVVVGIGEDFESTILVTALAKEFGVPVIVSRAYNPMQKRILSMVGATEVVNPEEEMGRRLARSLARKDVVDFIDLPEGYELREHRVTGRHHEVPLAKLLEDGSERIIVVRLSREVREVVDGVEMGRVVRFAIPLDDTRLKEGDSLVLIGPTRALERL
jgi:trk system potassium uptake protein TrkA